MGWGSRRKKQAGCVEHASPVPRLAVLGWWTKIVTAKHAKQRLSSVIENDEAVQRSVGMTRNGVGSDA